MEEPQREEDFDLTNDEQFKNYDEHISVMWTPIYRWIQQLYESVFARIVDSGGNWHFNEVMQQQQVTVQQSWPEFMENVVPQMMHDFCKSAQKSAYLTCVLHTLSSARWGK